jgi:hypothetical protein
MAAYRQISFESMHPGLSVRVMGDSNYMLVLDLLSVLAGNDRKKASQTLARVSSKPETADLLTHSPCSGKKTPRKLISFANAIQLLLVLPKRTVSLPTRRSVAGILADFFETQLGVSPIASSEPAQSTESLTLQQTLLQIEQQTIDIEHKRRQQPLDTLRKYLDLLQQCGPLSEDELQAFKRAVVGHMPSST